jgi:hypothetical protein
MRPLRCDCEKIQQSPSPQSQAQGYLQGESSLRENQLLLWKAIFAKSFKNPLEKASHGTFESRALSMVNQDKNY